MYIYIYKCDILTTIYTVWLSYIIFCRLLHIRSGKTRNLFSSLLCSLWWVQIFGYVLACRSYSFVCTLHHLIIIIVQTYLISQIYVVEYVSKIKHILSVIHYTICRAVCFQFTHFSCDDWENIYTLSYYHHQIGSMNFYLLFRVRSWNNGVPCVCISIFFNMSTLMDILSKCFFSLSSQLIRFNTGHAR